MARVLRLVLPLIAFFWILGHYRFFFEMNLPLLRGEGGPLGFFGGFFGAWSFALTNSPPLIILQSLMAVAMTLGLGLLLGRRLEIPIRTPSGLALGWLLGFCVSGIVFHFLASLHLQRAFIVWPVWLILLAVAWWFARRSEIACHIGHENPVAPWERFALIPLYILVAFIFLGIFWNALFFEETYWDALILYLGYARMTFLEGGFPFKAEAQVGIGLGANYPHLYPNYGALVSTMFGEWHTFHARLAAPIAGLATAILIHSGVRRLTASRTIAAATTVILCATPHFIAFATYASDYAYALLFSAAYAWVVIRAGWRPSLSDAALLAVLNAGAMHLNYLMGIFWGAFFVYFTLCWLMNRSNFSRDFLRKISLIIVVGILASTPWYARNYLLTGNPVYAFFPEIFTQSIRVNPEVLRSAELEWFRNGDGVGRIAEFFIDFREGIERDAYAEDFVRKTTLRDRFRASWHFWAGYDFLGLSPEGKDLGPSWLRRIAYLPGIQLTTPVEVLVRVGGWQIIRSPHSYKMSLFVMAFFVPGLLAAGWFCWRKKECLPAIAGILSLIFVLFFYHYVITDFYLYQIVGFLPLAAIFVGIFLYALWQVGLVVRVGVVMIACAVGFFPGIPFAMMNFKAPSGNPVGTARFSPALLDVFRNPGISPALMWRIQYGADPDMWDVVNSRLLGERLLTHENRHLVLDPSITLVHLDDWDIQAGYDLGTPEETLAFLRAQEIRFYLFVPNELAHGVNARLGMPAVIDAGLARELFRAGGNVLYELVD